MTKKAMINEIIAEGYITENERDKINKRLASDVKTIYDNMLWWKNTLNKTTTYCIKCSYEDGNYVMSHGEYIQAYSEEEAIAKAKEVSPNNDNYECVWVETYASRI